MSDSIVKIPENKIKNTKEKNSGDNLTIQKNSDNKIKNTKEKTSGDNLISQKNSDKKEKTSGDNLIIQKNSDKKEKTSGDNLISQKKNLDRREKILDAREKKINETEKLLEIREKNIEKKEAIIFYSQNKKKSDKHLNAIGFCFDYFFDNINIPIKIFESSKLFPNEVIKNNTSIFFFPNFTSKTDEKLLTDSDTTKFNSMFVKYCDMMDKIFKLDTDFYKQIISWASTTETDDLHLKLVDKKYRAMSPYYIFELYNSIKKTIVNETAILEKLDEILSENHKKILATKKKFINEYNTLYDSLVYLKPLNGTSNAIKNNGDTTDKKYMKKFVVDILRLIWDYSEKLIDLNFYIVPSYMETIANKKIDLISLIEKIADDSDSILTV